MRGQGKEGKWEDKERRRGRRVIRGAEVDERREERRGEKRWFMDGWRS